MNVLKWFKDLWEQFKRWIGGEPPTSDADFQIRPSDLKQDSSEIIKILPEDLAPPSVSRTSASRTPVSGTRATRASDSRRPAPQAPLLPADEETYQCPVWMGHQLSSTTPCPICRARGEIVIHHPIKCPKCHLRHSREGLQSIGNVCARCREPIPEQTSEGE